MKKLLLGMGVSLVLATSSFSGDINITTESFVKDGKEWKQTKKVLPGSEIKYVNSVSNDGDLDAQDLIITNNIPKNMVYIKKSAQCGKGCSITYSVDKGKTYDIPKNLKVKNDKKKKVAAKVSDYTSIKWVIRKLDAKSKIEVSYRAKVK